jgi:hypothetical protein
MNRLIETLWGLEGLDDIGKLNQQMVFAHP